MLEARWSGQGTKQMNTSRAARGCKNVKRYSIMGASLITSQLRSVRLGYLA